ncbi:hypothetical protein NQ176_g3205 [Zarea fungicola]|uniref:Uncharacterized protein n=1 Tax=Zarea fungicola TaxID=93591 RepID=A0ACC1NKA5_9HYPO|nr:hypothetical protein NQ176_g3205 [Lecanicillium fungicola]
MSQSNQTAPSEAESGPAAQRTVLSTPDLLIIILSQLPHSSLLKAQRVNKTWAGLFDNVELQAALFRQPRPKGSALYVEAHSDVLMHHFPTFWPINGRDPRQFHSRAFQKQQVTASNSDWSYLHDEATPELTYVSQDDYDDGCPHRQKWRQLLVCQPPVNVLELVQEVSRRGSSGLLEFRTIIRRPDGLRMGFLYDAVRHWKTNERSKAELLWNRQTGDIKYPNDRGEDEAGPVEEGEPCLTIWGHSSVGCGQYGGLTYSNYSARTQRTARQVIFSDDGDVEYSMLCLGEVPSRLYGMANYKDLDE